MTTEKLVNLQPDEILIRDNVRFNLKPYRVDSLAENILHVGGVREPILIEELDQPVDGKKYALQVGNYRHAAVYKLNTEQKAGLTLPCRVVPSISDQERLLAQVAENNERENMSPMDKAIAVQKMISAGISKLDIRKAFSTPGGRKGIKSQPASNSHINMLLSFLEFPKDVQRKIHDGVLGIASAHKLTKYPRDKWEPILEAAEAERIKEIDQEDREEATFLAQSKKAVAAEQAQTEATKSLEEAKKEAEALAATVKEKADALTKATQEWIMAKGEERKKATEHKKALEQELKAAQQGADAASKSLSKIEDKLATVAEKAKAAKERLEAARKAKAAKTSTKVKSTDLDKAAKAVGATGPKSNKLGAADMREAIKSLTLLSKPPMKFQKTIVVGTLIEQCFDGKITDAQLQTGIARLVGDLPPIAAQPAKK